MTSEFNPFGRARRDEVKNWQAMVAQTAEDYHGTRESLEHKRSALEKIAQAADMNNRQRALLSQHLTASDFLLSRNQLQQAKTDALELGFNEKLDFFPTAVLLLARAQNAAELHKRPQSFNNFKQELKRRLQTVPQKSEKRKMSLLWSLGGRYRAGMLYAFATNPEKFSRQYILTADGLSTAMTLRSYMKSGWIHENPEELAQFERLVSAVTGKFHQHNNTPPSVWMEYEGPERLKRIPKERERSFSNWWFTIFDQNIEGREEAAMKSLRDEVANARRNLHRTILFQTKWRNAKTA